MGGLSLSDGEEMADFSTEKDTSSEEAGTISSSPQTLNVESDENDAPIEGDRSAATSILYRVMMLGSAESLEESEEISTAHHAATADKDIVDIDQAEETTFLATAPRELKIILSNAGPLAIGYVLNMIIFMINLAFVGHAGEDGGKSELGAAALAIMVFNVTGASVGVGLLSAMDTLGSQPGVHSMVCLRSAVVLSVLAACVSVLWIFAQPVLDLLDQPEEVVEGAALYLRILVIALPFNYAAELWKRYLQVQRITIPAMLSQGVCVVVNIVANLVLVTTLEYGIMGSAIALTITIVVQSCTMVGLSLVSGLHRKTWPGFSRQCFTELGEYMRFGIPGTLMTCAEWWAFEIHALIAGYLGTTQLDANSVIFYTVGLLYMAPFAVGLSTAIRVGNCLGNGNASASRTVGHVGMFVTFCVAAAQAVVAFGARNYVGRLYSNNEEVIALVSQVLPVMALFAVMDGTSSCTSNIIRASGRQALGAVLNLSAHWAFGLPLAAFLALYLHMGLMGQWIGLGAGSIVLGITNIFIVLFSDWEYHAKKAVDRSSSSKREDESKQAVESRLMDDIQVVIAGSDGDEVMKDMIGNDFPETEAGAEVDAAGLLNALEIHEVSSLE